MHGERRSLHIKFAPECTQSWLKSLNLSKAIRSVSIDSYTFSVGSMGILGCRLRKATVKSAVRFLLVFYVSLHVAFLLPGVRFHIDLSLLLSLLFSSFFRYLVVAIGFEPSS